MDKYRSWWLLFGAGLGLGTLLLGLVMVTYPYDRDPVGIALGLGLAAVGGWTTFRVPFMRVAVTSSEVRIRGYYRLHVLKAEKVERVFVASVQDIVVTQAWTPVLLMTDGSEEELMQLAGYASPRTRINCRVNRQAQSIAARLGCPFDPEPPATSAH